MSHFTSLAQVESAREEVELALADTAQEQSAPDQQTAPGDDELSGNLVASVMGAGIHILSDVVQAMSGTSPQSPSERSHFTTDAVTGRQVRRDKSMFLGAAAPVHNSAQARPARDIMAAPLTAKQAASRLAGQTGTGARKPNAASPKTAKGLDLHEGVMLAGQALQSPTKGLRSAPGSAASQAALLSMLQGLNQIREKPTVEMLNQDAEHNALRLSMFGPSPAPGDGPEMNAPRPKMRAPEPPASKA